MQSLAMGAWADLEWGTSLDPLPGPLGAVLAATAPGRAAACGDLQARPPRVSSPPLGGTHTVTQTVQAHTLHTPGECTWDSGHGCRADV